MIAIVDYGLGNIKAFVNIYKRLNIPCKIVSNLAEFVNVTKLILPGVGSFDYAMDRLQKSELNEVLTDFVLDKKIPILGVCVGMQMFARSSEEGSLPGLGWIEGRVKKFDRRKLQDNMPLPHMGWNNIEIVKQNKLVDSFGKKSKKIYFLHSYSFECDYQEDVLAVTEYGESFSSIINYKNIYGIQGHPEKSHQNGIELLRNFGEL